MTSASHVSTPAAKRSALLPLGVALLAAASYAAGIVTPTILGSARITPSETSTTVSSVQPRQGPPDDLEPGVRAPQGDGTSMGH